MQLILFNYSLLFLLYIVTSFYVGKKQCISKLNGKLCESIGRKASSLRQSLRSWGYINLVILINTLFVFVVFRYSFKKLNCSLNLYGILMNGFPNIIKFALPCALFLTQSGQAEEQNLVQSYENSTWTVKGDSFACSLQQRFENYALLEVKTVPAQQQQLVFTWLLKDKPITRLHVSSRKADWQSANTVLTPLNFTSTDIEDNKVQFSADVSALLRLIKQGGWLDTLVSFKDEQLRLTFTNTHSDEIVADYQQCLNNLSPLSWEQARDHQLQFASGQRTVTAEKDLKFLKDLVRYISLDNRVSKVLVDGHTDNTGSPLSNRLLSKERADDVASRLIEFGLPKDMLEVRAHGQRYPIIKNSKQGASSNRRVLVRLFRHSS